MENEAESVGNARPLLSLRLFSLPLIQAVQSVDSVSTREGSKNQEWAARLSTLHIPRKSFRDSAASASATISKSPLFTSFSSIFAKSIKTTANKHDESSDFDETALDLKKWSRMFKSRSKPNLKHGFAVHRMMASTLVVNSSHKVKSSVPMAILPGSPVKHTYVRDSSSNLITQKERTLIQLYNRSSQLQKKQNSVSNRKLASLTNKVYQNTIDYLKH